MHEAYIRLVTPSKSPPSEGATPSKSPPSTPSVSPPSKGGDQVGEEVRWNSRGHFFAAAAEAMRRILVEQARRKQAAKRGGQSRRISLDAAELGYHSTDDELLDIDEALTRLAAEDPRAARLIQLRYFAGLSIEEAAEAVGISRSIAYEHWSYAKVRLKTLLDSD